MPNEVPMGAESRITVGHPGQMWPEARFRERTPAEDAELNEYQRLFGDMWMDSGEDTTLASLDFGELLEHNYWRVQNDETDIVVGGGDERPLSARLPEYIAALREAVTRRGQALRNASSGLGFTYTCEADSVRRTMERVLARFEAGGEPAPWVTLFRSSGEYVKTVGVRFPNDRSSLFLDEQTANEAATVVLRQHEQLFRAWDAGETGLHRLVMRADVGRVVGRVHFRDASVDPRLVDDFPADAAVPPAEVTWATVIMARRSDDQRVFVLDAFPDLAPDPAVNVAYPDLQHVFVSYFGASWTDTSITPWQGCNMFGRWIQEPARSRVAEQLDALLADTDHDDEAMRGALRELGSYILPTAAWHWVYRLRDAMDPSIYVPESYDREP